MSSSFFRLKLLCAAVAIFSASCAVVDKPIPLPEGRWEMTTSSFVDIGRMPGLARATLLLRDGRISAFSGCNTGTGAVSSVDGRMVATPLAVTRRACIEPVGSFEGRYFKLLQGKPYFRTEGDALILSAGDDSARFRRSVEKPAEKPAAKLQP
ncbi:MAG: META domain-containing protein [Burkholderiales bacterium]|nr:META domain-containing protein [Burkholderiales bacterium]